MARRVRAPRRQPTAAEAIGALFLGEIMQIYPHPRGVLVLWWTYSPDHLVDNQHQKLVSPDHELWAPLHEIVGNKESHIDKEIRLYTLMRLSIPTE